MKGKQIKNRWIAAVLSGLLLFQQVPQNMMAETLDQEDYSAVGYGDLSGDLLSDGTGETYEDPAYQDPNPEEGQEQSAPQEETAQDVPGEGVPEAQDDTSAYEDSDAPDTDKIGQSASGNEKTADEEDASDDADAKAAEADSTLDADAKAAEASEINLPEESEEEDDLTDGETEEDLLTDGFLAMVGAKKDSITELSYGTPALEKDCGTFLSAKYVLNALAR